jgi:hypothetical protein
MIAGPQIISSFFMATSQRWAACSVAYVRRRRAEVVLVFFAGMTINSLLSG